MSNELLILIIIYLIGCGIMHQLLDKVEVKIEDILSRVPNRLWLKLKFVFIIGSWLSLISIFIIGSIKYYKNK